jgi:hypothetical protein
MGRFYCRTEKKNRRRAVFLKKKKYSNLPPNLSVNFVNNFIVQTSFTF